MRYEYVLAMRYQSVYWRRGKVAACEGVSRCDEFMIGCYVASCIV